VSHLRNYKNDDNAIIFSTCDAAHPLLVLLPGRINVERILVVEDDRIALRNVSQFLSGEGYQVERANNGDEALKLMEKEKFDLVLSDVIMPGTDGHRLLAHVRSRFATTPIILMSGNFTLAPPAIFFHGANGYVLKPIDLEKLLQKIKDTFTK